MRILIVSDTHGLGENLIKALEETAPIDALIHCGDLEGQAEYIRMLAGCPCYMVAGNNDWGTDLRRELEFTLDDYRIFVTHGNQYGVSMGYERLRDEARSREVQIAMFGHTHRPMIEEQGNLVLLNPGSLSYPRQMGRRPSYLLMEIDREHQAHYTICYL